MGKNLLYLIDATAFCYRAFYALENLSTSFGQPTNAVYGFINMLNKILKSKKPEYLAICFDVSRDTFRQKKFARYKINRPAMPEGLSSQLPIIKQIISAYGISYFEKEGFEADDVIATIAKKAEQKDLSVVIISSDKDILQLVDDCITVFSPYKDEGVTYTQEEVLQRFGVEPKRIADIISIMGDDADNIPNVPGIGKETAKELINEFGSLEKLLKNIDKVKSEKIRKAIQDNVEKINLNKELVALDSNVDIELDLSKLKIREPDIRELYRLFKYLEFKKFLKELPTDEENKESVQSEKLKDNELRSFLKDKFELFLYGDRLENIIYFAKEKFLCVSNPGDNVRSALKDRDLRKISHDLKNIKVSLAKDEVILDGLYFDTMIAAYLLNPSKAGYDLADIAWDYLGSVPRENMEGHQALDLILKLRPKLEKELQEKSLLKLFYDLEMPLVEVLAEMELNGIKLDLKVLTELSRDIEKRLIKLIENIYDYSGTQFNINSPKQLRQILFEKLKLPVVKRSKTGPSTDEEVLRSLADKHKLPALLLEYRRLTKLKNTYVDTLPTLVDKKTARVHTSFNQTGTETGRLSSSNPNLQNIPIKTDVGKHIRRAIISSDESSYLLSCDYSQIELRILAHLSKDKSLIQAFQQDKDIHNTTASLIYGLDEKDITEPMREVAKRANFGIIYGLTSYGLSRDLGISLDDAQGFIDAYFVRYPKVQEYIQEQIQKAQKQGFVTTLLGRRRYIPEINNKNQSIRQFAERQAVNTPIQGSASDLIKLAMVEIHRQLSLKKLSAKMIMQIHDELVFDVKQQELSGLKELAKDKMENVLKLDVPVKVEIKKGKNWLEMEPA